MSAAPPSCSDVTLRPCPRCKKQHTFPVPVERLRDHRIVRALCVAGCPQARPEERIPKDPLARAVWFANLLGRFRTQEDQ